MARRWLALVVPLFAGCAVGPNFHRPDAPNDRWYTSESTGDTSQADGKSQHFSPGVAVHADWWKVLHCSALDAIVKEALEKNPGLEAARATLSRSQNILRAGYGVFVPQVDLRANASRQLYNGSAVGIPSNTYNLYSVSGTVSYPLDIWGGERRQVEGLAAAVDEQRFALGGAYVMLTTNVVQTVIAQAAYGDQIELAKETIVALEQQVRIALAQSVAGTAPYSNVLTLQAQLASTQATLPPLQNRIDQASHLLAALTGRTPANWKLSNLKLADFTLPQDLPISVPSQLVRQRADILIAEAQLHAANANIGVATAAMLPNITLGATYGVSGPTLDSMSPFWSVAASLFQPLLHGGTLNFQRKAAIDARNALAAQYRQTVLGAFQQVADTLRGLVHDADTLKAQSVAATSAKEALRLVHANYAAGIATYLQVLVADIQYLTAASNEIQARAQRLQDTVALYAALGGGWWKSPTMPHD